MRNVLSENRMVFENCQNSQWYLFPNELIFPQNLIWFDSIYLWILAASKWRSLLSSLPINRSPDCWKITVSNLWFSLYLAYSQTVPHIQQPNCLEDTHKFISVRTMQCIPDSQQSTDSLLNNPKHTQNCSLFNFGLLHFKDKTKGKANIA